MEANVKVQQNKDQNARYRKETLTELANKPRACQQLTRPEQMKQMYVTVSL